MAFGRVALTCSTSALVISCLQAKMATIDVAKSVKINFLDMTNFFYFLKN
jgi:hypothetical protein